jgi:hypothetical protein
MLQSACGWIATQVGVWTLAHPPLWARRVRPILPLIAVGTVAFFAAVQAGFAGEAPGRVIPDGKTSRGGDFGVFFNTDTPVVEGLVVEWGCASVNKGKPVYSILTHKGIGRMGATGHLSLSVSLPFAKINGTKVLGKARVTVNGTFQWGPKTTTSIRRATGKGTVSVKSSSCTTGTLTFTVRNH